MNGESKKVRVRTNKVDNVMGSSAGAGSGEFHTYRNLKRREDFRLNKLQQQKSEAEKAVRFMHLVLCT